MPTTPAQPDVLKVPELAKLLRMGRRQTYEAVKRGEIEGCHKIGSSVRCSTVAVEAWLHQRNGNGKEVVSNGARDSIWVAVEEIARS